MWRNGNHGSVIDSGVARNLRQGVCKVVLPSLPFPSPSLSLLSSPSPSFPLEVGPLKYSYGVWGSAVSSPSGVWGGVPAEIDFGAF